jgi:hypothetical protein
MTFSSDIKKLAVKVKVKVKVIMPVSFLPVGFSTSQQ